jgi:hypothetical protein
MRLWELLLDDAGTIKPEPPLTPARARRKAEKRTRIDQRIRDAQAGCAKKVADLRAKM